MRLVQAMAFVCALLLLALVPACVQFARATHTPVWTALALLIGGVSVLMSRRG
jgi:hypothetical protein